MDRSYAELEIALHCIQAETYQVELRFINPGSEAETTPRRAPCSLDPTALLPLQQNPKAYGETLTHQLFDANEMRNYYGQVKAAIEGTDRYLRIRLLVGPSAPELHALRWELLVDPDTKAPIATSEKLLFSRFMLSQDWRTVRLRPKAALQALVAVSAPPDVDKYKLAPVDLEGEMQRAQASLTGINVAVVGKEQPLTLDTLDQKLRTGIDLLYLVCHGILVDHQEPYLFLQDETGQVKRVRGDDFAQRISEMPHPPRLIVLASCESAGSGQTPAATGTTLSVEAALAPRLANAGVPAVIAMQGKISMLTIKAMMPVFFKTLLEDGQIDRAMAVARGIVRDQPDAWMPALFLRLRGGRIWYEPGFGQGEADTVKWKALINDIAHKRFTPIIGWGLGEAIYGSTQELAQRLAKDNHFPLAPYQLGDLPLVSQYLLVNQRSSTYPLDAIKEQMRQEIYKRHRNVLEPEFENTSLSKLLKAVGHLYYQNEQNPYHILAALPATVFIAANPDTLLIQALAEAGKQPDTCFAFWKRGLEPPAPYDKEPTVQQPLVYYLFGHFNEPDSLVLTEDDYFDYLIGASINRALVPKVVRHALTNRSLLFLGFQITDWSFRVLYRLIMSQEGGARRGRFAHAAVQIDPEDNLLINVTEARKYLQDYYGGENISIFWGGSEEFLHQLQSRLPDLSQLDGGGEDEF